MMQAGHYHSFKYELGQPLSFHHDLLRRLTPLQLATLGALDAFEKSTPEIYNRVFFDYHAPLFFASATGEMTALRKLQKDLFAGEKSVSPAAFQNSVHNASPAYFSIMKKVTMPHVTVSSGFLSPDRALYLADTELQLAADKCICIASSFETVELGSAHCEIYVVFSPSIELSASHTVEISYTAQEVTLHDNILSDHEAQSQYTQALFTPVFKATGDVMRCATNIEGETFISRWTRCKKSIHL